MQGLRGFSEDRAKSFQTAFDLAQKALAIDDSHDGAHSLLAGYYNATGQFDKGLSEAEREMREVGLRLPENWDLFDEDDW